MTLNETIRLIKTIAKSHKLVRHFFFGDISDWMSNESLLFPSVRLEITAFRNLPSGVELDCSMMLCDLVHMTPEDVNDDTLTANDIEVQSDMLQVANDIVAVIDNPEIEAWQLRGVAQGEIFGAYSFRENDHGAAGCTLTFTLFLPRGRNYCEVPIDGILQENSSFILSEQSEIIIEE
jgi:hypothetical protein